MADFLLVLLALLVAYVGFVFWLIRSGRLEKWNLSLMGGILLMVRTNRGKGLIDWIARPRRFWNLIGDLGIVLTLVGMVTITVFFFWAAWFASQPGSGALALGPKEIFVIPGVNPFVPLWYGLAGLIITLVVHEGGHGILARANGMKLKSLGLLWFIVPIGAFVEPEELDLKVAPRKARLRVFGAGPAVNIGLAAIALLGFSLLMGGLVAKPGYWVGGVLQDSDGNDLPAKAAGIEGGDIILSMDGQAMAGPADLSRFLREASPGQVVDVGLERGNVPVTLARYWDTLSDSERHAISDGNSTAMAQYCAGLEPKPATGPECADQLAETVRMGIRAQTPEALAFLAHPFTDGTAFRTIALLPVYEVIAGDPFLTVYAPAFYETPFHHDTFWVLANLLFWIFWINLMVGITNILPMLPLDGGHIFREAVGGTLAKLRPGLATERRDRIVGTAATTMSLLILAAFIAQIAGPHIVNALG